MKRELGISVYPDHSDPEKDKAYIKKSSRFRIHAVIYEYA